MFFVYITCRIEIKFYLLYLQKQIKYHVFNAFTNSELTELVPVFTIRPALPTSVKKVTHHSKMFGGHGDRHYRRYWRTS
jgi:hypothetical protein